MNILPCSVAAIYIAVIYIDIKPDTAIFIVVIYIDIKPDTAIYIVVIYIDIKLTLLYILLLYI